MPPKNVETTDDKLNKLAGMMEKLQKSHDSTEALLLDSLKRVDVLEEKSSNHQNKLTAHDQEIFALKNQVNSINIASRSSSVRLMGFPVADDESKLTDGGKAFSNRIYEKVIKPVLNAAKSKGEIASIPTSLGIFESAYRVSRATPGGRPPPIVVTFSSKPIRLAVLRNKKGNIPIYTTSDGTSYKPFIVEDLTAPTYRMLKELQEDDRVFKVWSLEGRLRYTLKNSPTEVHQVKSVFHSIESFI